MWASRGAVTIVLAFFFLGVGGFGVTASANEAGVVRETLENGLRVIIVRNTLAPVVTTAVNYLVGSNDTPPGFPGTAHALEHMLFRGSPGLSADQLANIGSVIGGDFNAYTGDTVTQYSFTVPAEDLDVALHIEALRMRDVLVTEKDWDQERGAIEQEVAQALSDPVYVLVTKLSEVLFSGTPYAHDALGTRPSFDKTTAAMLKDFYDEWYAPNNAILIVVGNVDPEATLEKVRELFGAIPPKKLPKRPEVKLQPVTPQSFSLDTDLPYGAQVIALRIPGLDSPDFAAAVVLADVLNHPRGELYGLVPQGKALGTDFGLSQGPNVGVAYALATFPSGGDAKALESEMRAILAKIAKDGVPPDLVAAAKLHERRSAEFRKNSISGLATVWSEAVAVNGFNSPDDALARIEKVTVEDVNRVAREYLDLDHAVTAVLTPHDSGKPVASGGFGGQEKITLGEAKPTPLPNWAEAALSRLAVPDSTVHPVISTLPNGITLVVQPEDISDTVSVYGYIKNVPELQVPKGKEGLSQVLDGLFSYGTERLDRVAFLQALDAIGAYESAGTNFWVMTLTENFERGVELLADNELHPRFPEEAFNIVKQQITQTTAGKRTSPNYLSSHALLTALYPKDDPFLRGALPETVGALTLQDVRDYYRMAFRPDLTIIVVIGKVTPEHARMVIEKYFGAWSASGPKPDTELPPVPPNTRGAIAVPDDSRVQVSVTLAETLHLTRFNPDYYALQLGNTVLGGAFYSSRLSRDIRKDAGLVYYVDSYFSIGKTRGYYAVYYGCDPQNVSKVQDLIVRELQEMQTTPVKADELQRAKALLLRRIPLEQANVNGIAYGIINRWALDLPFDEQTLAARRYLELGAPEVQAAFAKWLRPDDLVNVSQGPSPY
ncbi:MAG: M16 family metallopeptidase [bacterium]